MGLINSMVILKSRERKNDKRNYFFIIYIDLHIYIYIYIYRERESGRERGVVLLVYVCLGGCSFIDEREYPWVHI
jgi:hypothetical protein